MRQTLLPSANWILILATLANHVIAQIFIPYINQGGQTLPCDWNAHCPPDTICALRPEYYPHKSICYRRAQFVSTGKNRGTISAVGKSTRNILDTARKPRVKGGKKSIMNNMAIAAVDVKKNRNEQLQALNDFQCPPPERVARCEECHNVKDCEQGMVCCPNGRGSARSCTSPQGSADSFPKVIPIINGTLKSASKDPLVMDMIGSVTLIKAQRRFILVDTGTIDMKSQIEENLKSLAGISPSNISMLVTTHGHPDHYSNNNLFPHALQMFSGFKVSGSVFVENALRRARSAESEHRTCVRDLLLISTPGHTPEDITLMVENVKSYGQVAITGDLFLSETQLEGPMYKSLAWDAKEQKKQRKRVVCRADYIMPGHGPMFKVTQTMRSRFGC